MEAVWQAWMLGKDAHLFFKVTAMLSDSFGL